MVKYLLLICLTILNKYSANYCDTMPVHLFDVMDKQCKTGTSDMYSEDFDCNDGSSYTMKLYCGFNRFFNFYFIKKFLKNVGFQLMIGHLCLLK